jgi:hypothetical protein
MGPLEVGVVFAVLALIVAMRVLADRLDRERIREDVGERGGLVQDITWRPFGRGWFGEKSDRIYEVAWTDAHGAGHVSWCKTSLWTGVYWSENAPPTSGRRDLAALEAENRRLREELERAKRSSG